MIREMLGEIYGDDLIFMDGFDDCIEGIVECFGQPNIVCYDKTKVIAKLMEDGIDTESINLDTYDMPRREKAKALGWTDVEWTYDDIYGGIYLGGLNPLTKKWDKVPEMNIKITIEGCCSMRKSEIAKIIGERLKEKGFGAVSIIGTDYKGEYFKGLISDESATIEVVPEKFDIRDDFEGNLEYALKSRERNKIEINTTI